MISSEYVAGFIDGEGCIRCYTRQPKQGRGVSVGHRVVVTVANTHLGVLEKMQERWGGSIHKQKGTGRQLYVWNTSGNFARALLNDVHEHLIVKKPQSEIALKLLSMAKNRGRAVLSEEEIARREELRLALVAAKSYDDGSNE